MAIDEFGLTLKQRNFCDEYLISGNATDAARKAGYSEKTAKVIGAENLTKPAIKAYIASKRAKVAEKFEITQEYLMRSLKEIHEYNKEEAIFVTGVGKHSVSIKKMKDAAASIKAAELLGKTADIKLFVERKEVDVKGNIEISDDEKRKDLAKRLLLSLKDPDLLGDLSDATE